MRRYLLGGLISLVFAWGSMPTHAACTFVNKKTNISVFSFDVSDEDCELIDFNGESVVTLRVEYPSMKLVDYKNKSNNVMVLVLFPISVPPFDINRATRTLKTIASFDGVELLEDSEKTYRVAGRDGSNAYIYEWDLIYMGKRAYKSTFGIDYLFSREISNLKEADVFVLNFLDRFLIN